MNHIRVPLDQFAYVELEHEGSPEEALELYRTTKRMFEGGVGLEAKEWNRVLDNYLWGTKSMTADEYETMSPIQQAMVQEVKKSRKRLQAKE